RLRHILRLGNQAHRPRPRDAPMTRHRAEPTSPAVAAGTWVVTGPRSVLGTQPRSAFHGLGLILLPGFPAPLLPTPSFPTPQDPLSARPRPREELAPRWRGQFLTMAAPRGWDYMSTM